MVAQRLEAEFAPFEVPGTARVRAAAIFDVEGDESLDAGRGFGGLLWGCGCGWGIWPGAGGWGWLGCVHRSSQLGVVVVRDCCLLLTALLFNPVSSNYGKDRWESTTTRNRT